MMPAHFSYAACRMKSASSPSVAPWTAWMQLGALSMIAGMPLLRGGLEAPGAGEPALLARRPAAGESGEGEHDDEADQQEGHGPSPAGTRSVGWPWPLRSPSAPCSTGWDCTMVPSGSCTL